MLYLYHAAGSKEVQVLGQAVPSEEWEYLRQRTCQVLTLKKLDVAASLLDQLPFELREATNGFGDEFCILYAPLQPEAYVALQEKQRCPSTKVAFEQLARTVSEVADCFVRFVVAVLDRESGNVVPSPAPHYSSEVVERALADAEHLLRTQGPTSSLDRIHTAFHGYLKIVAQEAGIDLEQDASLPHVFKEIMRNHPAFVESTAIAEEALRVTRAMAFIVDAVNVIRNRKSLAHPNERLLEEPEAMLLVNAVRTLFHYVDSKLKDWDGPHCQDM